jgi:hypothetical protein
MLQTSGLMGKLTVAVLTLISLLTPQTVLNAYANQALAGTSLPFDVHGSVDESLQNLAPNVSDDLANERLKIDARVSDSTNSKMANGRALVRSDSSFDVELVVSNSQLPVSGKNIQVKLSGTALTANSKKVNVVDQAVSGDHPITFELVTDEEGEARFTIQTSGLEDGEAFTVDALIDQIAITRLILETSDPIYTLVSDSMVYAASPGEATNVSFRAIDQWGTVLSDPRFRVRLTQEIDGFTFENPLGEVGLNNGFANFRLTSVPSSVNRSARLTGNLQKFDFSLGDWMPTGVIAKPVLIQVTNEIGNFTKYPPATVPARVSYLASDVQWKKIDGSTNIPGAELEIVGGDGIMLRSSGQSTGWAEKIKVRSGANGEYEFEVASLKAGAHAITQRFRGSEAKTMLVVDQAMGSAGAKIVLDRTTLNPGEANRITGTLLDENGNSVQTLGSADVVLSWTGAGIPAGLGPVETDLFGKFSLVVLVPATERGIGSLMATYRPFGHLSSSGILAAAQSFTIEKRSTPINVLANSSNGQWLVRVENASGREVTIKAGSKWLKSTAQSDSFLVSGASQSGAPLPIKVWVNGALMFDQKITIR